MTITAMDLQPDVAAKAEELQRRAPGVQFLSGRRTVAQQAQAMAANVHAERDYILRTYAPSAASRALHAWVVAHPDAIAASDIAAGLEEVMRHLPEAELLPLSRHLTGRAFDVKPQSCTIADLESLAPEKLLTHEGGLERFHVQF